MKIEQIIATTTNNEIDVNHKAILLSLLSTLLLLSCAKQGVNTSDPQPSEQTKAAAVKSNQATPYIAKPNSVKPNIVFIFADDQSPLTIGAYGNKDIHTPNLDKLAAQGVNFSNAHNMGAWNGAVCAASRAMLISGRAVWQAHAMDAVYKRGDGLDKTWGKLMEEQGYSTYMTGKWHVHAPAYKVFQHTKHIRPGMPKDNWQHFVMEERFDKLENGTSTYQSYKDFMPLGYNRPQGEHDTAWQPTDPNNGGFYQGGKHWSEVLTDDALSFIAQAEQQDKPFFMYLAFNAPHDPRQAPQAYQDLYKDKKIAMPESWQAQYPEMLAIENGPRLRDAALAPFPRTQYATEVHIKEYYASVSHLDAQVGQILAALEATGKMENTYIIYTADHGLAVGEHGLFGKQNMYEHSIRAPFIIKGPKLKAGKTVTQNIYLQDAMATSLELAGAQKPSYVFFNSVLPLATGYTRKSAYDAIYGAYIKSQRMIKKDGFKLIVYPNANKIKLFDLQNDPNEINNLADLAQYKEKRDTLFKELKVLQVTMSDNLQLDEISIK